MQLVLVHSVLLGFVVAFSYNKQTLLEMSSS